MVRYMLTTTDNPYDPFTEFASWWRYDIDHGYNSSAVLARIARLSDALTEEETEAETKRAIDEIIKHDPFNRFAYVEQEINTREDEYQSFEIPDL